MYMSQALNDHELKYGITDKEGCAATWAIRQTRGYLRGACLYSREALFPSSFICRRVRRRGRDACRWRVHARDRRSAAGR